MHDQDNIKKLFVLALAVALFGIVLPLQGTNGQSQTPVLQDIDFSFFNITNLQNLNGQNASRIMITSDPNDGNFYVNGSSGSDNNDCLSESTACATIQHVLDNIDFALGSDLTIHIGNGTYNENVIIQGKPNTGAYTLTLDGTDALVEMINTTATGGNSGGINTLPQVEKTGAGWSINAYKRQLIYFVNGSNAGEYRIIHNNTATKLYLTGTVLPGPVNSSDTFVIYNWGAKINPVNDYAVELIGIDNVYIKGIKLDRGIRIKGANNFLFENNAIITYYQSTDPDDDFSRILSSQGEFKHNSFWQGNFPNYVGLDVRLSDLLFNGNKLEYQTIGLLSRVGFSLLREGNICNGGADSGCIRADNNGHVQFFNGGGVMKNFIISNGLGIAVVGGSGVLDSNSGGYTSIYYETNTLDHSEEAVTYSWLQ